MTKAKEIPDSDDVKASVANVLKEEIKPKDEPLRLPIIENRYKENVQYKVNIPKKFADTVGLNKTDFQAEFILVKKKEGTEYPKIKMEIVKKNG